MALITFTVNTGAGNVVNVAAVPQRAKLVQLGGAKRSITFPYGPQGVQYSDMGINYETTERPGLKPLLTAASRKLRTVSVVAVLAEASDGGKSSIEDRLAILEAIASENEDCSFTYGVTTLPFRARVSEFSYTAVQRDLDGNITQAQINITLQEKVVFSQSVVALKAITYDPPPVPASSSKSSGGGGSSSSSSSSSSSGGKDTHMTPYDVLAGNTKPMGTIAGRSVY